MTESLTISIHVSDKFNEDAERGLDPANFTKRLALEKIQNAMACDELIVELIDKNNKAEIVGWIELGEAIELFKRAVEIWNGKAGK